MYLYVCPCYCSSRFLSILCATYKHVQVIRKNDCTITLQLRKHSVQRHIQAEMYAYTNFLQLRSTLLLLLWMMMLAFFLPSGQWSIDAQPANFRLRFNLPSICLQPPPRSESVCAIEIEGFYYDVRTNDCELYVVGGCRTIPGQSFGSRQDCLATCVQGTRRIQDLHANE